MSDHIFPRATPDLASARKSLTPDVHEVFKSFSAHIFAEGALSVKTKQLIAVAAAHITQCPYCIRRHTTAALWSGASGEEIMEAVWVAAEMRAGGAHAHSLLTPDVIEGAKESL